MKISERAISIAALLISLASMSFSYLQTRSAEKQLLLNAQQLRPHLTYTPTFFPLKQGLRIDMYLQNESPLPANVLFDDVSASVNGEIIHEHFYSIRPDIIYQGKDGVSTLPLFAGKFFPEVIAGKSTLWVATCAIYTPTAESDQRRWQIDALNEYVPGLSLPRRWSIVEREVTTTQNECDAKAILAEFNSALQKGYFGDSDVLRRP